MATMLDVLNGASGRSAASSDKFPNHVLTGRYASGFSNSLMAKDVQLYLRAVADQDGPATVGTVTAALWDAFAARGSRRRLHPHLSLRLAPGGTMTVNTKPLSDSVGAEVLDVDRDRLLHDDLLADDCLELARPLRRARLPRAAPRRRDPGRVQQASWARWTSRSARRRRRDLPGDARPGEEPGGRLPQGHVRLAHRRHDRRHPDHGHGAERARGRGQGRRHRVRQHLRRVRALSDEEQERALDTRVVHSFLAAQQLSHPTATRGRHRVLEQAAAEDAPAGLAARERPQVARARRDDRPRRGHGRGRGHARYLADLLDRSTAPERVYRHEWAVGDLVIWDNRGVLHRATRYDPSSARDMHRTTIAGNEAVQ